jgi:hypothetical protein
MPRVTCSACGTPVDAPDHLLGQTMTCPSCHAPFTARPESGPAAKPRSNIGMILVLAIGIPLAMALVACCGIVGVGGYVVYTGAQGVKKAQEKQRIEDQKQETRNKLVQLALAMENYHQTFHKFPASAISGPDGKPLLSWRVDILPWLDEGDVFKEFRLNEPWDSPHNKALISRRPKGLAPPEGLGDPDPTMTYFQVITGSDTVFPGGKFQVRIPDITDGTTNTFLIVDAGNAVPWTKPDDLTYKAGGPLPKLGGRFTDGFHAAMADGHVQFFRHGTPATTEANLRALITRNGGETVVLPD